MCMHVHVYAHVSSCARRSYSHAHMHVVCICLDAASKGCTAERCATGKTPMILQRSFECVVEPLALQCRACLIDLQSHLGMNAQALDQQNDMHCHCITIYLHVYACARRRYSHAHMHVVCICLDAASKGCKAERCATGKNSKILQRSCECVVEPLIGFTVSCVSD